VVKESILRPFSFGNSQRRARNYIEVSASHCDLGNGNAPVGIVSTPVIDMASKTLYVEARTKENGAYFHRLHALNIASGAEKFGGPIVISASVSGTGEGSINGILSFDPLRENNRPALLFLNSVVYIAFASRGEIHPYHGWVIGYAPDPTAKARMPFHRGALSASILGPRMTAILR